MLTDFKGYLIQKGSIKPLYIPYYLKWVSACCTFLEVSDSTSIDNDQKDRFLAHLAKSHEDWQVKQADTALRLYGYFLSQQLDISAPAAGTSGEWKTIEERLREALRLRHRSYSTEKSYVMGKGDKDRRTVLPEMLKNDLIRQMSEVRELFDQDRQKDLPGVCLPNALERKYPNAGKEWGWFWLFPSKSLSVDPRSHIVRRHHMHPASLQKAFKAAAGKSGVVNRHQFTPSGTASRRTFSKTAMTSEQSRNCWVIPTSRRR